MTEPKPALKLSAAARGVSERSRLPMRCSGAAGGTQRTRRRTPRHDGRLSAPGMRAAVFCGW